MWTNAYSARWLVLNWLRGAGCLATVQRRHTSTMCLIESLRTLSIIPFHQALWLIIQKPHDYGEMNWKRKMLASSGSAVSDVIDRWLEDERRWRAWRLCSVTKYQDIRNREYWVVIAGLRKGRKRFRYGERGLRAGEANFESYDWASSEKNS